MSGLVGLIESFLLGAAGLLRRAAPPPPLPPPENDPRFLIGTAMPFGAMGPEPGSRVYADGAGNGHELVCGRSGSGKTHYVSLRIAWECARGDTLAAIDFLGDGVERILRAVAASHPEADVALVDLLDGRHVPNLNVLQGPGSPQARAAAAEKVFRARAESWGVRIGYRFLAAAEVLAEAGFGVVEMRRLYAVEPGFRAEVLRRASDGPAKDAILEFDALGDEQKRQQWIELASKVYPFVSERRVADALAAGSSLDLGRFLDERGWITLVSLGTARYPAAYAVGMLLVDAVERHVMARAELPPERRGKFRLYLDEARHVADMGVESLLAEGRRLGASVTLCTQFMGMLDAPLRASLRANCATKILLASGAPEAADLADEVVTDLPKERVRQELVSLKVGEAIVCRAGLPSAKVRMPELSTPAVADDAVDRLRLRALAQTGVPLKEAEAAMRERAEWIESLRAGPQQPEVVSVRRPMGREGPGA